MTMSANNTTFLHWLIIIFFYLLSGKTALISNNPSDISYEIFPFIRVYRNGTVERLSGTETVPASLDPTTGVQSKDIYNIVQNLNISARLYLPKNTTQNHKIPLLVYFYCGGFFTGSACSPTEHNHLNSLVAEANIVAVSVNYRLAPEKPLPIAYQDSWLALKWVFSHCKGTNGLEPWLKNYVDFTRVYVGGASSGANIAHNMAIRAGLDKTGHGVELHGMFLNCPHFWGEKRIGNEINNPLGVAWVESIWVHAYPNSTGFDDPLLNPGMDPNIWNLGCRRVLVYVAENDVLRDRGFYYEKALRESKWDGIVNVIKEKGEVHVFNLLFPNRPKAKMMIKQLASFLNGGIICGDDYHMLQSE